MGVHAWRLVGRHGRSHHKRECGEVWRISGKGREGSLMGVHAWRLQAVVGLVSSLVLKPPSTHIFALRAPPHPHLYAVNILS